MSSRLQNRSGFTIVELLIVIVVIGILATLVLTVFTGTDAKARDTQRKTDLKSVKSSLEVYFAENGHYPSGAQLADATFVADNLTGLDAEALVDPNGASYAYTVSPVGCDNGAGGDCTDFTMTADLEVDENGDGDLTNDTFVVDGSFQ